MSAGIENTWHAAALADSVLETVDIVLLNLVVAADVPALNGLDIDACKRVVDSWTDQFRLQLPRMEERFHDTPECWKNDIRLFRVGMLQGFLGHSIGMRYVEQHKDLSAVHYTNPSDLFLNGLLETRAGTCASMAVLHVAMSRQMGWPVSLACAGHHLFSRFEDADVVHNIESTSTHLGAFASDSDEDYLERFRLPKKAVDCGSDLRKLTAREMLGVFVALRGRHYRDIGELDLADRDFALSRVLFPNYRHAYIDAMVPMLTRGKSLFDDTELGHPKSLFHDLAPAFGYPVVDNAGQRTMTFSEFASSADVR
jgi:hypothetical protein